MLKIGIIGVGYLGNFHLNNLLNHENIEIPGFFDINEERSQYIANKYSVNALKSRQELLDACDAVLVVAPTNVHYEIAKDALENGLHVFCEKPVTEKVDQARDLMTIANKKNRVLQVGHIERFNPAFKILEKIDIDPQFIECDRISMFNDRGINSAVIPELMIHDLDILLTLVDSNIKSIDASGTPVLTENIDIANVRIVFNNGCVANLTASRVSDKKIRKFRIFSKNKYLNIDFLKKETDLYTLNNPTKHSQKLASLKIDKGEEKSIYFRKLHEKNINAMLEEQKDFIHAIKNHKPPLVTGEDGLEALKLANRIEKIIKTNLSCN